MKRINLILIVLALLFTSACHRPSEGPLDDVLTEPGQNTFQSETNENEGKTELLLMHSIPDFYEENEETIDIRSVDIDQNLNNTVNLENAVDLILSENEDLYPAVTATLKYNYPKTDTSKWKVTVNKMDEENDGMIILKYWINNEIVTNKAAVFTVSKGYMTNIYFTNMDFEADENRIIESVNDFKNTHFQEKRSFSEEEKFISEETTYSYMYNLDKIIYTYQLYFYEGPKDMRVINNEYGSEYLINEDMSFRI